MLLLSLFHLATFSINAAPAANPFEPFYGNYRVIQQFCEMDGAVSGDCRLGFPSVVDLITMDVDTSPRFDPLRWEIHSMVVFPGTEGVEKHENFRQHLTPRLSERNGVRYEVVTRAPDRNSAEVRSVRTDLDSNVAVAVLVRINRVKDPRDLEAGIEWRRIRSGDLERRESLKLLLRRSP